MPKQTVKSALAGKLGDKAKKSHLAHKGDETEVKVGGDVPPGVLGLAKVTDIGFALYKNGANKGKPYFFCRCVHLEPKIHGGVPITGLRVSFMEAMCDTVSKSEKARTSFDDHYAWVLNFCRVLGANTEDLDEDNLEQELEEMCAALKEAGVIIRYRSWAGQATKAFPDPRTNYDLMGLADTEEAEAATADSDDGVQDDNEPAADEGPVEEAGEEEPAEEDAEAEGGEEAGEEEAAADEGPSEDEMRALAKKADNKKTPDKKAAAALTKMCESAGIDPEPYESWDAAVDAIMAARGGEEPAEEEEEEAAEEEALWEPAKGDNVSYKLKGAKKATQFEITAIDKKASTATIKSLDDGKSYKAIALSALTQV